MRWALVIGAGLAGLLLGGAWVAATGVILVHAAIRLRQLARTRPDLRVTWEPAEGEHRRFVGYGNEVVSIGRAE